MNHYSDRDFGAQIANHLIQIGTSEQVCEYFGSDRNFGAGLWTFWFRSELQNRFTNSLFRSGLWIWFRLGLRSTDRKSFDLDRNIRAGSWIIIQIATLERVLWIIWFRSRFWSADCKSFDSDRNFGAGSQIFWFRSELRNRFMNSLFRSGLWIWFRSGLRNRFVNILVQIGTSEQVHEFTIQIRTLDLIQIGTSEHGSQIIWFRSEHQSGFVNHYSDRDFGACIVNHLIQIKILERRLQIIWFRSELRSRFANLLVQVGTSEQVHKFTIQIRTLDLIQIGTSEQVCEYFGSDRNFGTGSQIHYSDQDFGFDSDRDFGTGLWIFWFRSELRNRFTNSLFRSGLWIWFRSGLRSTDRKSFDLDQSFQQVHEWMNE